ncbi:nuclear transport factor 2 family protein [Umezakia ovalisporum]|uniref:Nuclear transport factor 2 family protein n=2 Tax=Umezakia ovalisporum TaxID=75695 RepID=A0AA43H327_9CYAN|nr:nuclear transport factor 2 family protein [Umezakia ovalisporum]MBI1242107.1 nuclear transport factor 2 family protein [Nostoc sp. RI_552]MDH6056718.1 nuclear transport factor 2 family protein [Umezakia ovalisporum FSS-43]MDH6065686.1 nuclear transport factor 2 family protein [Umezakia ovalisporum FSS-62]MDH6068674.1 nuclear transport factor 2 family protein [Umezakia ovalisporum APH033B]MDH6070100.1 nuclear transport factor 2 family protein [Umezakia ovalisporum CobakiLakeA]
MINITALLLKHQQKFPHSIWLLLSLLMLGVTSNLQPVAAKTPGQVQPVSAAVKDSQMSLRQRLRESRSHNFYFPMSTDKSVLNNAPTELKNLLSEIDAAATLGDLKALMQLYSPKFTSKDGLNFPSLEKSLIALWKRYPRVQYSTQLQSWKTQGKAIIAETVTNITGLPSANSNNLSLNATIKSRQRIEDGKIVYQEILSERSLLTSGKKPPQVNVVLPQQVKVGQEYNFDAIVQEPLGDDFLLGTALEEPVQVSKYLNPTSVELNLLTSGGLFKVGRAPSTPGNLWVSAVILRGDGMTMVTQRMQVVK